MTPNNNIMILPFYTDILKQSRYKKWAFGKDYPLLTPINYLLPFQIPISDNYTINYIQLFGCEDNEYNITFEIPKAGGTGYYTQDEAIATVPVSLRELGFKLTFGIITNYVYEWFTYDYIGTDTLNATWNNLANWVISTSFNDVITGSGDITIETYTTYKQIINTGATNLNINKRGNYYLKIALQLTGSTSHVFYYSEWFTFTNLITDCIKIEYWNTTPFYAEDKIIIYDENETYKNKLYLQTHINRPTYDFTENGTEKDGYLNIESIISKKIFNFSFPAPEFLCDAIRLIGMHDNILLTYEGETYEVNRFTPNPKWENSDYLANVEVNFECNTVLKSINKLLIIPTASFDSSFDASYET